jgi:hypothetical protein
MLHSKKAFSIEVKSRRMKSPRDEKTSLWDNIDLAKAQKEVAELLPEIRHPDTKRIFQSSIERILRK